MSNQYLKLRRSGVPGKIPTTESIDFGEIALNTYDGIAYMKRSGSNGEEVVPIGSNSGSFSGSFTGEFSGSFSGSGANLSNIPASAIVGLSLSQISSGSYSASISEAGLLVNNTVIAPSFTGSLYGTASWAENALFANDYIFTSSILEYYVDRRFSESCQVVIDSTKTITSTNPNYLVQLSASRIGDPNHPWPDPWSAGFAASASVATGQITSARIIIKTGNEYTYGSSTLSQNGDKTGSLVNNTAPDIGISQINYNSRLFNLLSPNLEFYFEPETALYDINKSWTQELVVYTSSNWDIAPEFKITGKGKFVLVYGSAQGKICRYGTIIAPRAEITIEADQFLQNMNSGWFLYGQKINVDVNKWWAYPSVLLTLNHKGVFNIGSQASTVPDAFWNWPSQSIAYPSYNINVPQTNVNINELRYGEELFGEIAPIANTTNAIGFSTFHPYGSLYNINIDKFLLKTRATQFFRTDSCISNINGATSKNNTLNVNINYISHSRGNQSTTNLSSNLFTNYRIWQSAWDFGNNVFYENCNQNINIKKVEANGLGLIGGFYGANISNCNIKLNCEDYTNYGYIEISGNYSCISINKVFSTSSLSIQGGSGSFVNNTYTISGTYKNYSSSSLMNWSITDNTNNGVKYTTLTLDNFKGYQLSPVRTLDFQNSGSINFRSSGAFFQSLGYVYSNESIVVIKDSLLYATGSIPILYNGTVTRTPTIILDNVLVNKDIPGGFNYEGSMDISSNVSRLIY